MVIRACRTNVSWEGLVAGLLILSALGAASMANDPPDFSGLWKLNSGSSDFAGETAPESKIQRVEQRGNSLDVTIDEISGGNPAHGTSHYTLDGKEGVNVVFGNPLKATVTWEGAVLVMRTWGDFGGAAILLIDRWSLSQEGKILIIARHFEGRGRTVDQRLVFDRR